MDVTELSGEEELALPKVTRDKSKRWQSLYVLATRPSPNSLLPILGTICRQLNDIASAMAIR